MRKAISIAMFELKRTFQKPQSYILMFAMPLLFTLIFGSLFSSGEEAKPHIVLVDQDKTNLSNSFIKQLVSRDVINTSESDIKFAEKQLEENKINGYIVVEKGFEEGLVEEKNVNILFKHSPTFDGAIMLEKLANNNLQNLKLSTAASVTFGSLTDVDWKQVHQKITNELLTQTNDLETEYITKGVETAQMDNITARATGFTIMFVMFTMLSSTGIILEAKQLGVWHRLMSTPIRKVQLSLGYLVAFFVIGWIQFGILMLASTFIFDVYWGDLMGNVILISSLLLCTIGIGLFIAGFVKTTEQQSVFGSLVIVSTCMLAGVYWPLEIVPDFMQQLAKFVPQYWAMDGFTELTVRGGSMVDILSQVGFLGIFTLFFLGVGVSKIKYE